MKHEKWLSILLLGAVLTGCDAPQSEPMMDKVTGTLMYRERMMLSPEAVARVSLEDVSLADAPARVIGEVELDNPGQVPIDFEIEYDPAVIDERMSYSVRAQIFDRGRMMFTSDTHNPVLTRGAGKEVEIRLVSVPDSKAPEAKPEAVTPKPAGIELAGMFTYMADAAIFEDCRTNKVFPVAMEGAYIELERAYSNSGIAPGESLLVQIEGRYLERPAMEGNHNEVKLIVDSFTAILPEQSCVPPLDEALENTYWKLIELDGKTVKAPKDRKEAHMILKSGESRVNGNAGCNNFFGTYVVDGDSLRFGQMGATMMACLDGMDTEQDFLAALGKTNRHTISGLILSLYKDETLLAKLEAIHLP